MLSVCLKDLVFNSLHGLYAGEQLVGGRFLVNVKTFFLPSSDIVSDIGETLNYEQLFKIVKQRMDTPTGLIETLAMQISTDIRASFPWLAKVWVSIEKCGPPIPHLQGSVVVEYTWPFPDFEKG